MKFVKRITDRKLQRSSKSEFSSGKNDNNEYFTGEEISSSNQSRIIEPPKFTQNDVDDCSQQIKKTTNKYRIISN